MADFFKRYILLPVGLLLQIFGYVDSIYLKTGVPYTFLMTSAGFIMLASFLVWVIWFSHPPQPHGHKTLAIVVFVGLSLAYYSFVQYSVMLNIKKDVFRKIVALETARSLARRDPNEAIVKISTIERELNEVAEIYNIRAVAYYTLGKYKEAMQDFKKAAKLEPENRQYIYNIATALREMCDFEGAKEILDNYVNANRDDMWGHYDRGIVYHLRSDFEIALGEYNIVIANKEGPVESAFFNSAVIYALKFYEERRDDVKQQYLDKVISNLERSIRLGGLERVYKIKDAMIPIAQRTDRCEGYYATDELTNMRNVARFMEWFQEQ